MSETSVTDAGKPVTSLSPAVVASLQANSAWLATVATATGLSATDIAAPIAREMNKTASGDYSFGGTGSILTAIKNTIAIYGPNGFAGGDAPQSPLTEADYRSSLLAAQAAGASNAQSAGITGYLNRVTYPVLNDLGIAKIQLGAAMNAVQFYNDNKSLFSGNDTLGLAQYIGNTPQLAEDLIGTATSLKVSVALQAVIDVQANQWAASHIAGWADYDEGARASFITAFSTLGQQKMETFAAASGSPPGQWTPNINQMTGANF